MHKLRIKKRDKPLQGYEDLEEERQTRNIQTYIVRFQSNAGEEYYREIVVLAENPVQAIHKSTKQLQQEEITINNVSAQAKEIDVLQ